jgi:GNAT superfamily N-acetyltransferase/L-amino acid N-acyltransferase YncA
VTLPAIAAVGIPADADAESPASAGDLFDCCQLEEGHHLAVWGNTDRCLTFREAIHYWKGNDYEDRRLFLARLDGVPVGTCSLLLPLRDNLDTAWIEVLVAAEHRRRGIGRRLLEAAEKAALERSRTVFKGACEEPLAVSGKGAEMLPAKSGTGGMPMGLASTGFALASEYSLEQVETSSSLGLPVPESVLGRLEADARQHSGGYRLVTWDGYCPEELASSYAALRSRMSTDAPQAGLAGEAENWDTARVREEEETWRKSGVESLVSAVLHAGSGEMAGYTVLTYRQGRPRSVIQQDTLVSAAHRGHRLGMLIKVANLRSAQQRWPAARSVLTWNASENQHMLAINISLGFRPAGYEGEWQKRLG